MKLEQRLAIKLLAQASAMLGRAVGETLCTEPDRRVIRALLDEAKEMVAEFEEQYFEMDEGTPPAGPTAGGD